MSYNRHYVVDVNRNFKGVHVVHFLGGICVTRLPGVQFLGQHAAVQGAVSAARSLGYAAVIRCPICAIEHHEKVA